MGEEAQGVDSGSRDCDHDCEFVVGLWGGIQISLEWICASGGEQKQCRVDIIEIVFVWLFLLFAVSTSTMSLMG